MLLFFGPLIYLFISRCCEYALLILEHWPDAPEIHRSADLYEDLIRCCVADAMSEVFVLCIILLLSPIHLVCLLALTFILNSDYASPHCCTN